MRTNILTDLPERALEEHPEIQQRRSRAVRTAWLLAAVAVMIFSMFILSGVTGN